jgi:hypothetical protein
MQVIKSRTHFQKFMCMQITMPNVILKYPVGRSTDYPSF